MAVNYDKARKFVAVPMAAICVLLGVALFVMTVTFLTYPNFIEEYISISKVKMVCAFAVVLSILVIVAGALSLAATVLIMAVNYDKARKFVAVPMAAICVLLGVALFVMTVTFLTYPNFIEEYISISKVKMVCAFAVVLSILVIVAGALSLAATVLEDLKLLKISIAVIVVAFVLNIICIIVAFVLEFRAQEDVNDQIYEIMRQYNQEEFQEITDSWDFFQKKRECCGSDGPGDWKFTPFFENGDQNQLIPRSCCIAYATTEPVEPSCQQMSDPSLYYTQGCRAAVNKLSWMFIGIIVGFLGISSICEIIGAIASWVMIKELSKDDSEYPMQPPPSTAPTLNNYSGTMKSQMSGAVGSRYGSQKRPLQRNFDAPPSETGSVQRSDDGQRNPTNGFRNQSSPQPFQPEYRQQPSITSSTKREIDYRPQLPPPPPPPANYTPVANDDNDDFDV